MSTSFYYNLFPLQLNLPFSFGTLTNAPCHRLLVKVSMILKNVCPFFMRMEKSIIGRVRVGWKLHGKQGKNLQMR